MIYELFYRPAPDKLFYKGPFKWELSLVLDFYLVCGKIEKLLLGDGVWLNFSITKWPFDSTAILYEERSLFVQQVQFKDASHLHDKNKLFLI